MSDIYEKLKEMNISLPSPPPRGGLYTPVQSFGTAFCYCSGCGPDQCDGSTVIGKLGLNLSVEDGQEAARRCMLNLLANLDRELGDLNRIKRFVKVLAFANCTASFDQQPQVINGASQLLMDLVGPEAGLPARSAIGTNALPGGIACEIEVLVE